MEYDTQVKYIEWYNCSFCWKLRYLLLLYKLNLDVLINARKKHLMCCSLCYSSAVFLPIGFSHVSSYK